MAYVAISQGLISSTEQNIRAMRDKEKATHTAPPESGTVPNDDGNMMTLLWGDHHHLRAQMPDVWKCRPGKLTLRLEYRMTIDQDKPLTVDYQLTAPNGFECPITTNDSNSAYYGIVRRVSEHSHLLPQGARDLIAHRKMCREADKRWGEVQTKVVSFLKASKSLNEGLKLWPGLALYISKDFLDRANSSVKREKTASRAEEVLASISIDDLTAAAVASKLTV